MFSDPQQILSQLPIMQGSIVADLGAGAGFYTLPLSMIVGDKGKVYSIDIQKQLLTKIANEARAQHRYNVEVIWGDMEKLGGTKLRESLCDMAIVANILFQIEHKDNFINELRRVLKQNGTVVVIDWMDSFGGLGPHPDHVVTEEMAKSLFEKKSFTFVQKIDAGAHHYGMIFKKA